MLLTSCGGTVLHVPYSAPPVSNPPAPDPRVVKKALMVPTHPRDVVHEVGPLETIWRLHKMYDVPMSEIYRANGLKPGDTIYIGQKLTIPKAKTMRNVVALYPNSRWRYIVIHHTATEIGKAMLINRSHKGRGFWNGLGYHFLVDNGTLGKGDGQIEMAPRWIKQQTGAHCQAGRMNSKGIGVALVGNFNHEDPTRAQLQSLTYLVNTLSPYYRIPLSRIMGHRDVPGAKTDCPGRNFPWRELRARLTGAYQAHS